MAYVPEVQRELRVEMMIKIHYIHVQNCQIMCLNIRYKTDVYINFGVNSGQLFKITFHILLRDN